MLLLWPETPHNTFTKAQVALAIVGQALERAIGLLEPVQVGGNAYAAQSAVSLKRHGGPESHAENMHT